jgi:hypothetical protein
MKPKAVCCVTSKNPPNGNMGITSCIAQVTGFFCSVMPNFLPIFSRVSCRLYIVRIVFFLHRSEAFGSGFSRNEKSASFHSNKYIINKPILTLPYSIKGLCLGKYFNIEKKFQIKKLKLYDNLPLRKRTFF